MKYWLLMGLVCLATLSLSATQPEEANEVPFVFVVPSYNVAAWYEMTLESIFNQEYTNYRAIIIDDNSDDGTADLIESWVQEHGVEEKVTLIRNTERRGQLANRYYAIHEQVHGDEVVFLLDGDDFVAHPGALTYLNEIFQDEDIWVTYGQNLRWCSRCEMCPFPEIIKSPRCGRQHKDYPSSPYPPRTIKNNEFRSYARRIFWHPFVFRAWLFKQIALEDLCMEGTREFYPYSTDWAVMMALLELAGIHGRCLPLAPEDSDRAILYLYNRDNPINCHKINRGKTHYRKIRGRRRYEPLYEAPTA